MWVTRFSLIGLVLLSSCATFQSSKDGVSVSYLDTVKQNYEEGEKRLTDKSYDEALAYFEHVRSKYPYSKYAALSDLKIGDTYFAQEKWLEAADAYDFYIRFHPQHEQNAYAWFQVAKSYYNALPSEFFIFPHGYVKDQFATKEAIEALDRYLAEYPNHEKRDEAQKMRTDLRSKLALRDLHVAKFYAQKKKWNGALSRYDRIVKLYADTPCAPEALYEAALIAERKLSDPEKAAALREQLKSDYPESTWAKKL